MGICTSGDIISKKLKSFLKEYKDFNLEDQENNKSKRIYENQETKLYEHYKTFIKYKEELNKTNKQVYESLFNVRENKTKSNIVGLKPDDEEKFYFFFNLRNFTEIRIKDSYINFPRFAVCYFPKFKPVESTLTSITINDSNILFNESQEFYFKLKNVTYLDLSYNNIDSLPNLLNKLGNLVTLNLRRNNLVSLTSQYKELRRLLELDLSENKIKKIPEVCFELSSLEKLNLNSNQLDSLESNKKNNKLKYLFLSNNFFSTIPHDIVNFESLIHLSLDSNKISELNANTISECKSYLKISLSNNQIKNRDASFPNFKNDILSIDPKVDSKTTAVSKETKDNSREEQFGNIQAASNQISKKEISKVNEKERKTKVQFESSKLPIAKPTSTVVVNSVKKAQSQDKIDIDKSFDSIKQEGIDETKKTNDAIYFEARKRKIIDELMYKNSKLLN